MKYFTHCPICHNVFVNDKIYSYHFKQTIHIKKCYSKLNHTLVITYDDNDIQEMLRAAVVMERGYNNSIYCSWSFVNKTITINNMKLHDTCWFEPDFTNYKKLLNKVKTYITLL